MEAEAEVDIREAKEEALAYASAPWYERLKKRWILLVLIFILLITAASLMALLTSRSANATTYKPWYAYDEDGNEIEIKVGTDYYGDFETAFLASDSSKTSIASSWDEFYDYLDENNLTTTSYAGYSVDTDTSWYEELAEDAFENGQYVSFFSILIMGTVSNLCEAGLSLVNDSMDYILENMTDAALTYLTGSTSASTTTSYEDYTGVSYSTTSYASSLLGSTIAKTIYPFIKKVSENIVKPAAISLLSLVLLFSLLKIAARFDAGGGVLPGVREVFALCVCAALYIWFVNNAFSVMSGIFSFFQSFLTDAMGSINIGSIEISIDYELSESDIVSDGSYVLSTIWWYVLVYIVSLIVVVWIFLAVIKFGVKLICTSLIRGIQIYMLLAFSPLPFVFIGLDETRQWGLGYLRHFAAVSLQGLVIYMVAYIFPALVTSITTFSMGLADGVAELVLWGVTTRALVEAAASLLDRTGDIASSVLGG